MVGAFVNEEYVPVDYILQNKDRIRIMIEDLSYSSKIDWIDKTQTSLAKRKIREGRRTEMKLADYFGDYKNNNLNISQNYMNLLDKELKRQKIYNFGGNFFNGPENFNYKKYLFGKKLNKKEMDPKSLATYIAPYFQNIPNWNNPGTMINVIPPVNLISAGFSAVANLYNPNIAQDTYSGLLITSELEVVKYLSDLIEWNWEKTWGAFTFGGKGTNLYATKAAINKADPTAALYGCEKNKFFMITSANGHPCHFEVCSWLGVGAENCYEIKNDSNNVIDLVEAERVITENIEKGRVFLGFNLAIGSTNELYIDPIKKINELNKKIVKKYNLKYIPHIHADSVLGWIYLFYNNYDFKKNPLNIQTKSLVKIKHINNAVKQLKYVDSVGIDFHKTGFAPYNSSVVIFKNKKDYFDLNLKKEINIDDLNYGNYNQYHYTLELSRSSSGPLTALCSLKSLGIEGFQKIIANMFSSAEYFRDELLKDKRICIINPNSNWLATLFFIKPKKYENLNLNQIINLSKKEHDEIREYNINYAKYVFEESKKNSIRFVYTSSRSYKIENTNIKIGAIKAYPMSVFSSKEEVDNLIAEITNTINKYEIRKKEDFDKKIEVSDNMVYR